MVAEKSKESLQSEDTVAGVKKTSHPPCALKFILMVLLQAGPYNPQVSNTRPAGRIRPSRPFHLALAPLLQL